MRELPEHVRRNRAQWKPGRRTRARDEPAWGIWGVPEPQVGMFPDDVAGLDVIELGCGTAHVSAWLARRGARPVGIDNSLTWLREAAAVSLTRW